MWPRFWDAAYSELRRKGFGGSGHPQVGQVTAGLLIDGLLAHAVPSIRSA